MDEHEDQSDSMIPSNKKKTKAFVASATVDLTGDDEEQRRI